MVFLGCVHFTCPTLPGCEDQHQVGLFVHCGPCCKGMAVSLAFSPCHLCSYLKLLTCGWHCGLGVLIPSASSHLLFSSLLSLPPFLSYGFPTEQLVPVRSHSPTPFLSQRGLSFLGFSWLTQLLQSLFSAFDTILELFSQLNCTQTASQFPTERRRKKLLGGFSVPSSKEAELGLVQVVFMFGRDSWYRSLDETCLFIAKKIVRWKWREM